MIIVKETAHDRFTITPKELFEESTLSWKAKGMLAWITSHSVGYHLCVNTIIKYSKESRDGVYSGLKELAGAGYLYKHQPRLPNGKLGRVHYLASQHQMLEIRWMEMVAATDWLEVEGYEPELSTPQLPALVTASVKAVSGKTVSGKSDTKSINTKNNNNKKNTSYSTSKHPTLEQVTQYFAEKGHPKPRPEAEKFWLFYDSKGWKVGKTPMVKWKSSAALWYNNNKPSLTAPADKPTLFNRLTDRSWAAGMIAEG